jgi:serine phosphatase RsbU (regulator of sigma subunit)/anti-sigma regulatory factor (Ser/Thr protein kinase)
VQPLPSDQESGSRSELPPTHLAPSRARAFVRAVIAERALKTSSLGPVADRLADDAALLTSELVTNALIHAGTAITVICRPESSPGEGPGRYDCLSAVVIEVVDRQPGGRVPGDTGGAASGRNLGMHLMGALAESWGVAYRRTDKGVWFRLAVTEGASEPTTPFTEKLRRELEVEASSSLRASHQESAGWAERSGAFLAEASELLSGQLDEDMVAAIAAQLMVPRLADWCAVWLTTETGEMRLSSVWHEHEQRIDALRRALRGDPPSPDLRTAGTPWPWPESADQEGIGGSALAFSLVSAGVNQGSLIVGRAGPPEITDAVARTVEDVARRVAQALVTARRYTYQTTISRALQRRQLPSSLATLPGVESAIVYEPHSRGQTVGGDFYDLFPLGNGHWCFLLGDVQGKDPEAMSVTGLTRQLVRLLAREGHGVRSVLDWLNSMMAEDAAEAVNVGGESARPRFLSMVYGELTPDLTAGGALCNLASAGHPLPLRLTAEGHVAPVVASQMLLGIDERANFTCDSFYLAPGETLLCVTDGVTERRDGHRQLDDDEGLAEILRRCVGMGAMAVAERVRRATHDFSPQPVEDDLAVLVLHAVPHTGMGWRDTHG